MKTKILVLLMLLVTVSGFASSENLKKENLINISDQAIQSCGPDGFLVMNDGTGSTQPYYYACQRDNAGWFEMLDKKRPEWFNSLVDKYKQDCIYRTDGTLDCSPPDKCKHKWYCQ